MSKIHHVSHSSLMAADNCLKMYHETRLAEEKPVEMPAKARDIGILAHAYIEAFFKGQDFLDKLIDQNHTEHHAEAMAIFSAWKNRFSIPEENWLFTEREGHVTIEGVPDLVGYDDFVYQDGDLVVIRDFKTGWGTDVSSSYNFQGDLACLRYSEEFPGVPLASEVEFVRRGIVSERRVWSPALRLATIDRVKAIWAKIQSEMELDSLPLVQGNFDVEQVAQKTHELRAWPATPGSHCTLCPVIAQCAKGRRAQAAGLVVADEQSAKEAILEVALMEEALGVIKAALRPYVDAHGPVSSGDGKYDYEASFSGGGETESIKDVKSVLDITGHDLPKGVIKLDLKLKGAASLLSNEKVQAFIERKPSSPKFTVKKRSAKDDE